MRRKEEINKEANNFANTVSVGEQETAKNWSAFISGAEWADRTMLNRVYDFCIANIYKYGKVKFVDDKATFDFRMNTFLNDLKQVVEE